MKTLIVEDDFTNRELMQSFLAQYGECHIAVNGREAVDAVRAALRNGAGYDLICMDIEMPEMNGHDAVRQIRGLEQAEASRAKARSRIIMTTGSSDSDNVLEGLLDKCDAYLVKPISASRILRELRRLDLVEG
jgi:two-component system chemotaxis response regulator CheY